MADYRDNPLFKSLQRLFSTDVVIRNVGGKKIDVIDSNQIQSHGKLQTNSLIDRYNRIHSTSPTSLYGSQFNYNYQFLRPQLYSEYDVMDQDAIIASALDIIADEATLKNDMGEILSIRSSNEDIQDVLYNLFYDVLNVEFNLWSWIRQMCKYGDFFLKLEISEQYGVYNVIPFTAYHISRIEGVNTDNPAEVLFQYHEDGIINSSTGTYPGNFNERTHRKVVFENFEMTHFRLVADTNYLPYGRSYIEPARKLFKQYTLMEDAMLIHRIVRAPEKRIFYVNVGSIPPNEIDAFMQKTITGMKRTPYVNEKTGDYNLKYNMQNMMEDFYIPVRGNDQATKIDTTKGLDYDGINDVEYLRDKLFAALKVPKAFLGYDENIEGKATLAAEDIRFARTIERIQRIVVSELQKIALIHLKAQGFKDEELSNFSISMQTPSIIFEQEKLELMKSKAELAQSLLDSQLFSSDWIYDKVYHLSEDQYDEMRDLVREDSSRKFRNSQLENEGNDPIESGKSYGTPHDLASLYDKQGRIYSNPNAVPKGYDDDKKDVGRPVSSILKRNKQDDNFGKDRLGVARMKDTDKQDSLTSRTNTNKSGLALENTSKKAFLKNKSMLRNLESKKLKDKINKIQMLNEDQSND